MKSMFSINMNVVFLGMIAKVHEDPYNITWQK